MASKFDIGPRIGIEGEKEYKKALSDIKTASATMRSEMKLVASQFDATDKSMEGMIAKSDVLERSIEQQKSAVSTLEKALENASKSYGTADKRTQKWQQELNKAKTELNNLERELDSNEQSIEDLNRAFAEGYDNIDDWQASLKKAGDEAEVSGGKFDKLKSIAGNIGKGVAAGIGAIAVAAAAATVAVGGAVLSIGDQANQATNTIAAMTGASGTELEGLGAVAERVYTQNFGESLDDAAQSVANLNQVLGLSGSGLENAAKSGIALRGTFGIEMEESTRGVQSLMANLGASATEAYDLIAYGAQNGANKNGDLLDTLNEYGVHYKQLGLDAGEFMQTLVAGSEAGMFSIDKVGDAVKEFGIRAKDGSQGTMEAFAALGLNAEEMSAAFAKGGDAANDAFYKTLEALVAMEDPLAQNAAGVALMGTMYEDLGPEIAAVMLSAKEGSAEAADAMQRLTEVRYDNLQDALQGVGRSFQGMILPAAKEMAAGVTDAFSDISNAINESGGDMSKVGDAIGQALNDALNSIGEQLPAFIQLGADILTGIVDGITANLDTIVASATDIMQTLLTGLVSVLPGLSDAVVQIALAAVQLIVSNLPAIVQALLEVTISVMQALTAVIPTLMPQIVTVVTQIVQMLVENAPLLNKAGLDLLKALCQGLIDAIPVLIEAAPTIIRGIVDALMDMLPELIMAGLEINAAILEGILKAVPALLQAVNDIGAQIVAGVWEGIQRNAGKFADDVKGFFKKTVDGAKSFLGINSPSKVFAEIGGYMAEGLGVGFEKDMAAVTRDMQAAIPTSLRGPSVDFGIGGRAPAQSGISPTVKSGNTFGDIIINFTGAAPDDPTGYGRQLGREIVAQLRGRGVAYV